MTPTLQLGQCSLFHGASFKIVPELVKAGIVVDHTITDPPYSDNTHKNAKTNKSKRGQGIKLVTFEHYTNEQFLQCVADALNITRAWVIMTCDYKHAALTYEMPEFVRLGGWFKTNPMPQISGDRPGQGFETVITLHGGKVRKEWNGGGKPATWTHPTVGKSLVPTQKPLSLVMEFVQDFTNPGDLILDTHMGSGTTAIACIRTGRRYIGIEALHSHFEISAQRVRDELAQGVLFVDQAAAVQATLFA